MPASAFLLNPSICIQKRRVGYLFFLLSGIVPILFYMTSRLVSLTAWDMIWMRNVFCFLSFLFVAASLPGWETDVVDQHFKSSSGNISFLILDIRLVVRRSDQEIAVTLVLYHVYGDMGSRVFFSFLFLLCSDATSHGVFEADRNIVSPASPKVCLWQQWTPRTVQRPVALFVLVWRFSQVSALSQPLG